MKIHKYDVGHTTKMAAMSIMDKNLQKSSLKPVSRFLQNLVCSIIQVSKYKKVVLISVGNL